MNIQKEKNDKSTGHSSKGIPVLSEYAKSLESWVKERYLQKVSVSGVDPASITAEQFSPECLRVPNRFGGMRDLAFFRRDIRDLS